MNLAAILDDCLQRIHAGESIAGCLARYPDQAADLAPMLAVAAQMARLADQQPSAAQRERTLARMRQEAASQRARQRSGGATGWLASLAGARRLALVAVIAIFLLAGVSAGVVASSQPGQPAYELRVIVERAPALVALKPAARTAAELDLAERRLADLQGYLARAGQVQPAALRAMLASDRAAARQALRAGEAQRLQVAAQLTRRARLLAELSQRATDPATARALAAAALETRQLAQRLRNGPSGMTPVAPSPTPLATQAPVTASATPTGTASTTASPTATATGAALPAAPAQEPTATAAASATVIRPDRVSPTPGALATLRPRPRQTALVETATALAQTPPPHQTPRPRLTALAQTATAQAQTPSPTATATPGAPQPGNTPGAEPTATASPAGPGPVPPVIRPRPPRPPVRP